MEVSCNQGLLIIKKFVDLQASMHALCSVPERIQILKGQESGYRVKAMPVSVLTVVMAASVPPCLRQAYKATCMCNFYDESKASVYQIGVGLSLSTDKNSCQAVRVTEYRPRLGYRQYVH